MKITIEQDDLRMVIDSDNLHVKTGMTMTDTLCPDGCGCPHRAAAPPWNLSITGTLDDQPKWERV